MTSTGVFVEVQGAGEEATFSTGELNGMIELGQTGIRQLIASQRELLRSAVSDLPDF
jgi:ribonuclease PH